MTPVAAADRGGMLRFSERPTGALSEWVELIWLHAGETPNRVAEQILPRASTDLVVELGDERTWTLRGEHRLGPATIVGPAVHPFVLEKARRYETLGVVFKPGAARVMLGCAANELRERRIPLADLWKAEATELRERVVAARSPHQKLAEAEHVLSARLAHTDRRPDRNVARAAARIAAAPERCGIGRLSEALGMSRRRLEESFRASVGVTPKEYQRLQRFRQALERIDRALDLGWAAFALECGYYDQSHFNNEFRAHAGLRPSEYLAARGVFTNHVPLQAAG